MTNAMRGGGLWAVKWAFVGLMLTALPQAMAVVVSGSVARLGPHAHDGLPTHSHE